MTDKHPVPETKDQVHPASDSDRGDTGFEGQLAIAKQLLLNLCCACVGKVNPRCEPYVDARKFLGLE